MGTSIPTSSLITYVRTSVRNSPIETPRAAAASSSVYSTFPDTHSTIRSHPFVEELLFILGVQNDNTQSGRVLIWDIVLPDFTVVLSDDASTCSGEQGFQDSHHQGVRHHRGANSAGLIVRLSAKPAQGCRDDCPPPVRETAEPKMAAPERNGGECQRQVRAARPMGNPLL